MSDEQASSLRTAKLFEFYVQWVWPLHRRLTRIELAKRCSRCAASERMSKLSADGVCRECVIFEQSSAREEPSPQGVASALQTLDDILRSHQGSGKDQYDALVPFSGGKDSTYLIKRISTDFPSLRLLTFTIDNGYMSEVAKANVTRTIRKLAVDHLMVTPRKAFYDKLFRYCFTHLNDMGGYGTVDFSDGEFMLDTARTIAAEKAIPLILCGYSRYQVQNGLGLHHFETPRELELGKRSQVAGLDLADIFSEDELTGWWDGTAYPPSRVSRLLFPLYAWDLEEEHIKRELRHWGLLSSKEVSPIVTNHRLIPLIGVVDVHNLGYSSFEIEFCRMIREGKAESSYWRAVFEFLEYSARTGMFTRSLVNSLLDELGLTETEVGISFK